MLIGISGKAGSGKDTIAEMIEKLVPWSSIYHLADPVKAAAMAIDPWVEIGNNPDGTVHVCRYSGIVSKYGESVAKQLPEVRRLYQRIGTEMGRNLFGENFWIDMMYDWYYSREPFVTCVVPDVRFQNEAFAVRNVGGIMVAVTRPDPYDLGENLRHASETELLRIDSDYTISNDGDMEALGMKVQALLMEIGI